MDRMTTQIDRIFIRPQYAVSYRRVRRARWKSEPRADYAALFLLKGNLTCSLMDQSCEIVEGGALLLEPGASASASGGEAEFLSLTLSSSFVLDCAIRTHKIATGTKIAFRVGKIARDERLTRLVHDLAHELRQEEAGQEIVIGALMDQLVVHLLRSYASMKRSTEMELSRVGFVDRRIRRAVELMHAHLDRELPLEEIAAAAYLSPFHFARLFKKLTGASPHAYLATLRNARAQTLLAETDLSISEVSTRVGYASPSHFTKAFRQTTGMTPRAFRKAVIQ